LQPRYVVVFAAVVVVVVSGCRWVKQRSS